MTPPRVAQNEPLVVEVVARVHAHAVGEPAAHRDLALRVEQRDFYPVNLRSVLADDRETRVHGLVDVTRAPIARELRIEHVAQPVEDHGLSHLPEDGPVDPGIIVGPPRHARQRPARHQDHPSPTPPSLPFHVADLLLVGALHVGQRDCFGRRELVGARAARDRATGCARFGQRPADQFARERPAEPHATLRRVHRFGDGEPERPEVAPVGERGFPVEGRLRERISVDERVTHDMRRGVGHPAPDRFRRRAPRHRLAHRVRHDAAVGKRETDGRVHRATP